MIPILLTLACGILAGLCLPLWEARVYGFLKPGEENPVSPGLIQTLKLIAGKTRLDGVASRSACALIVALSLLTVFFLSTPYGLESSRRLSENQNPLYSLPDFSRGLDYTSSYEYAVHLEPNISSLTGFVSFMLCLTLIFILLWRLPAFSRQIDYEKGVYLESSRISGVGYMAYGLLVFTPSSILAVSFFGVGFDPMYPGLLLLHLIVAAAPVTLKAGFSAIASHWS